MMRDSHDIDDMMGDSRSNTDFNFMMENSEFNLDFDDMTELPRPNLDTRAMMEMPQFDLDSDVMIGNPQPNFDDDVMNDSQFNVGAFVVKEEPQTNPDTNALMGNPQPNLDTEFIDDSQINIGAFVEDPQLHFGSDFMMDPQANLGTEFMGNTQFDNGAFSMPWNSQPNIDPNMLLGNPQFNHDANAMPGDSYFNLDPNMLLENPLFNLDINGMTENHKFDLGTNLMTQNSQPIFAPNAPIQESKPKLGTGASACKHSATERLIRGKVFHKVAEHCTVKTLLALRLADKRMYRLIHNHVISTGFKNSKEQFNVALTESPRWKRSFRQIRLHYLCREHRVEELGRMLVNFARDNTGFRPSLMTQEEIEARVADGWRTNIYLRNIYRQETRRLRNDPNADVTMDQPDGMENLKQLALSRYVQDLHPEKCFDFLLTRMYFEVFLNFVVNSLGSEWRSVSAANRRRLVWAFIHTGANFTEDIFRETGECMVVNRISEEMRRQAESHFIGRFAAMNDQLLTVREAHVDELLQMMKVRICRLKDEKFKEALRAFYTFSSCDNLDPAENSLADPNHPLERFKWF